MSFVKNTSFLMVLFIVLQMRLVHKFLAVFNCRPLELTILDVRVFYKGI